MAVRRVYFERGSRLFSKGGKAAAGTPWGTWAILVDPSQNRKTPEGSVFHRTIFIPAWSKCRGEDTPAKDPAPILVKAKKPVMQPGVKRMLDLFSGTGSVGDVFRTEGFEVVSVDSEPKMFPDIVVNVLNWDYRSAYPVGHFEVIFACPPCTQFSQARTTKKRDFSQDTRLVEKTLEIIEYFQPQKWFIENPRGGYMRTLECLSEKLFADFDYCQFADWGYKKPTRIWGGPHIRSVPEKLCDPQTCPHMVTRPNGARGHRESLGGPHMRASRLQKYRVPENLVRHLCGFPEKELVDAVTYHLRLLQLPSREGVQFLEDQWEASENFVKSWRVS